MRIAPFVLVLIFPTYLVAREKPSKAWLDEYAASPGENSLVQIGDKHLVPMLIGEDVASQKFRDYLGSRYKNYKINEVMRINHGTIPKNVVISQDPEKGALVKNPGVIKIIVSDGR